MPVAPTVRQVPGSLTRHPDRLTDDDRPQHKQILDRSEPLTVDTQTSNRFDRALVFSRVDLTRPPDVVVHAFWMAATPSSLTALVESEVSSWAVPVTGCLLTSILVNRQSTQISEDNNDLYGRATARGS